MKKIISRIRAGALVLVVPVLILVTALTIAWSIVNSSLVCGVIASVVALLCFCYLAGY